MANLNFFFVVVCVLWQIALCHKDKPHFQIDHKAGKLDISATPQSADILFGNDNIDLLLKPGSTEVADFKSVVSTKHDIPQNTQVDNDNDNAVRNKDDITELGARDVTKERGELSNDNSTMLQQISLNDTRNASMTNETSDIKWKGRLHHSEDHSTTSTVLKTLDEIKSLMSQTLPNPKNDDSSRFSSMKTKSAQKDEYLDAANAIIKKVEEQQGAPISNFEENNPEDTDYVKKAQEILNKYKSLENKNATKMTDEGISMASYDITGLTNSSSESSPVLRLPTEQYRSKSGLRDKNFTIIPMKAQRISYELNKVMKSTSPRLYQTKILGVPINENSTQSEADTETMDHFARNASRLNKVIEVHVTNSSNEKSLNEIYARLFSKNTTRAENNTKSENEINSKNENPQSREHNSKPPSDYDFQFDSVGGILKKNIKDGALDLTDTAEKAYASIDIDTDAVNEKLKKMKQEERDQHKEPAEEKKNLKEEDVYATIDNNLTRNITKEEMDSENEMNKSMEENQKEWTKYIYHEEKNDEKNLHDKHLKKLVAWAPAQTIHKEVPEISSTWETQPATHLQLGKNDETQIKNGKANEFFKTQEHVEKIECKISGKTESCRRKSELKSVRNESKDIEEVKHEAKIENVNTGVDERETEAALEHAKKLANDAVKEMNKTEGVDSYNHQIFNDNIKTKGNEELKKIKKEEADLTQEEKQKLDNVKEWSLESLNKTEGTPVGDARRRTGYAQNHTENDVSFASERNSKNKSNGAKSRNDKDDEKEAIVAKEMQVNHTNKDSKFGVQDHREEDENSKYKTSSRYEQKNHRVKGYSNVHAGHHDEGYEGDNREDHQQEEHEEGHTGKHNNHHTGAHQNVHGEEHGEDGHGEEHREDAHGEEHREEHREDGHGEEHREDHHGEEHGEDGHGEEHGEDGHGEDHREDHHGEEHREEYREEGHGEEHREDHHGEEHREEGHGEEYREDHHGEEHGEDGHGEAHLEIHHEGKHVEYHNERNENDHGEEHSSDNKRKGHLENDHSEKHLENNQKGFHFENQNEKEHGENQRGEEQDAHRSNYHKEKIQNSSEKEREEEHKHNDRGGNSDANQHIDGEPRADADIHNDSHMEILKDRADSETKNKQRGGDEKESDKDVLKQRGGDEKESDKDVLKQRGGDEKESHKDVLKQAPTNASSETRKEKYKTVQVEKSKSENQENGHLDEKVNGMTEGTFQSLKTNERYGPHVNNDENPNHESQQIEEPDLAKDERNPSYLERQEKQGLSKLEKEGNRLQLKSVNSFLSNNGEERVEETYDSSRDKYIEGGSREQIKKFASKQSEKTFNDVEDGPSMTLSKDSQTPENKSDVIKYKEKDLEGMVSIEQQDVKSHKFKQKKNAKKRQGRKKSKSLLKKLKKKKHEKQKSKNEKMKTQKTKEELQKKKDKLFSLSSKEAIDAEQVLKTLDASAQAPQKGVAMKGVATITINAPAGSVQVVQQPKLKPEPQLQQYVLPQALPLESQKPDSSSAEEEPQLTPDVTDNTNVQSGNMLEAKQEEVKIPDTTASDTQGATPSQVNKNSTISKIKAKQSEYDFAQLDPDIITENHLDLGAPKQALGLFPADVRKQLKDMKMDGPSDQKIEKLKKEKRINFLLEQHSKKVRPEKGMNKAQTTNEALLKLAETNGKQRDETNDDHASTRNLTDDVSKAMEELEALMKEKTSEVNSSTKKEHESANDVNSSTKEEHETANDVNSSTKEVHETANDVDSSTSQQEEHESANDRSIEYKTAEKILKELNTDPHEKHSNLQFIDLQHIKPLEDDPTKALALFRRNISDPDENEFDNEVEQSRAQHKTVIQKYRKKHRRKSADKKKAIPSEKNIEDVLNEASHFKVEEELQLNKAKVSDDKKQEKVVEHILSKYSQATELLKKRLKELKLHNNKVNSAALNETSDDFYNKDIAGAMKIIQSEMSDSKQMETNKPLEAPGDQGDSSNANTTGGVHDEYGAKNNSKVQDDHETMHASGESMAEQPLTNYLVGKSPENIHDEGTPNDGNSIQETSAEAFNSEATIYDSGKNLTSKQKFDDHSLSKASENNTSIDLEKEDKEVIEVNKEIDNMSDEINKMEKQKEKEKALSWKEDGMEKSNATNVDTSTLNLTANETVSKTESEDKGYEDKPSLIEIISSKDESTRNFSATDENNTTATSEKANDDIKKEGQENRLTNLIGLINNDDGKVSEKENEKEVDHQDGVSLVSKIKASEEKEKEETDQSSIGLIETNSEQSGSMLVPTSVPEITFTNQNTDIDFTFKHKTEKASFSKQNNDGEQTIQRLKTKTKGKTIKVGVKESSGSTGKTEVKGKEDVKESDGSTGKTEVKEKEDVKESDGSTGKTEVKEKEDVKESDGSTGKTEVKEKEDVKESDGSTGKTEVKEKEDVKESDGSSGKTEVKEKANKISKSNEKRLWGHKNKTKRNKKKENRKDGEKNEVKEGLSLEASQQIVDGGIDKSDQTIISQLAGGGSEKPSELMKEIKEDFDKQEQVDEDMKEYSEKERKAAEKALEDMNKLAQGGDYIEESSTKEKNPMPSYSLNEEELKKKPESEERVIEGKNSFDSDEKKHDAEEKNMLKDEHHDGGSSPHSDANNEEGEKQTEDNEQEHTNKEKSDERHENNGDVYPTEAIIPNKEIRKNNGTSVSVLKDPEKSNSETTQSSDNTNESKFSTESKGETKNETNTTADETDLENSKTEDVFNLEALAKHFKNNDLENLFGNSISNVSSSEERVLEAATNAILNSSSLIKDIKGTAEKNNNQSINIIKTTIDPYSTFKRSFSRLKKKRLLHRNHT